MQNARNHMDRKEDKSINFGRTEHIFTLCQQEILTYFEHIIRKNHHSLKVKETETDYRLDG